MTNSPTSGPGSLRETIQMLGSDGRLVHLEEFPPSEPNLDLPSSPLPAGILEHLAFDGLWSHQSEAFDRLTGGDSSVVVAGTGSGKSLCYQLPIADAMLNRPGSTALVIYPTKALAHNQLTAFKKLTLPGPGIVPATYDGDSKPDQRLWMRRNANVILTNPEMLHLGMLPNHQRWSSFLTRLRYVIVDELHVYRGIFGTNMAHVMRRLRRVCAHHGSKPTFGFTSATIDEPQQLASELIGDYVHPIVDDGSPRAAKLIGIWSANDEDPTRRSSSNQESAMLSAEFITRGHHTLTFCRSRQGTETVTAMIKDRLSRHPELAGAVSAYRGGYLPEERREVEDKLFDDELKGVVATSALELGIDIGGLDVAIVNGFPGTVSSFRQQVGRVGRRDAPSIAVLVAGTDQLDQWLVRHPTELMSRRPERVVINPENPFVLRPHLACAAHELPLSAANDAELWPDSLDDGVRDLFHVDLINIRNKRAAWIQSGSPAREISLRSGGGRELRIEDSDGTAIGTIDEQRGPSQVHPGARYVHQGRAWEVVELDLEKRRVRVRPDERGSVRTHALSKIDIEIVDEVETKTVGTWSLHLGDVEISEQVTRFQLKDRRGRLVEDTPLDLPPTTLVTTAFWACISPGGLDCVESKRLAGSLHAIEHAAIGVLPLFTICDRWDVGGVSTAKHRQTGSPTLFIHDAVAGGAGVAALGYDNIVELLETTGQIIADCPCHAGCPACIQSPKCGNGNQTLDKAGATKVLRSMQV